MFYSKDAFEQKCFMYEGFNVLRELEGLNKEDWKEAFRIIKKFYILNEANILSRGKRSFFKPYATPIWLFMNRVEQDFYLQYTSIGGASLYPSYFCNGYYLDFACPYYKFGIEIDGKQFHNSIADAKRDNDLGDFGWTIFRIEAKDVLKEQEYLCDIEGRYNDSLDGEIDDMISSFFSSGSIGLLYALRFLFFDSSPQDGLYFKQAFHALSDRTINQEPLYQLVYGK